MAGRCVTCEDLRGENRVEDGLVSELVTAFVREMTGFL